MQYKNLLLGSLLIFLFSCEQEDFAYGEVCPGGCYSEFTIEPESNPDAYLGNDGYWRVKHNTMNYFTIRGEISELNDEYILNGVPLVETKFDSNYWVVFENIQFTTPMYGYLGWFNDTDMNTPLPVGDTTYTISQLAGLDDILNIVGYSINKHMCMDCPYTETLLGTYSKYNYHPTQNIFFDDEMGGDTAIFYIETMYNSDLGERENVNSELKVIFE